MYAPGARVSGPGARADCTHLRCAAAGRPRHGTSVAANAAFVFAESHIARRLRRMARRARMRPIRTIALTVRPASARAAAITRTASAAMRSALPSPRPLRRRAQPDLPRAAALPRPAAAGLRAGWRRRPGDRLDWLKRAWWERRSIASTTAAPARARSAWLRAGYSARPVRGRAAAVRSTLAGGFGSARGCWEIHSARASAIDLRVIVRCCGDAGSAAAEAGRGRSWRRGACELVVGRVALLPEIPALTFGDAIDAIVPMAARGGRALRRGQATVGGGLGRGRGGFRCLSLPGPGDPSWWPDWRLPRHRQGEPGRISRNGSTCTTPATQRNATLDAPNLVRDLGRNEPQFRSGWGIIGACAAASIGAGLRPEKPAKNAASTVFCYCLEAVQRPVHPSDRTNEPEPVRPEKRPELFQLKPWTDPPLRVEPFGLTDPELNSPEILPPEMTNLSVLLPQGVPTATATHEPSKLPPPPPPFTTASARRAARLIGFGLGATRRLRRFDRAWLLARTGQRLFVIADAAAGAAGLRYRRAAHGDRAHQRKEANSDRTLSRVFHNDLFQYFPVVVSNRAIASTPSTFRCSRPIAGTFRRRCGRTGGRW